MQNLGIYKEQYKKTIATLSEIEYYILKAKEEFDTTGGKVMVEKKSDRGAKNYIINPILTYIDKLNNSKLAYYKELGFTAQSFKKLTGEIVQERKTDPLTEFLIEFERNKSNYQGETSDQDGSSA